MTTSTEAAMANEFRVNYRSGVVLLLAIVFLVLVFVLYVGRSGDAYVEETIKISELIAVSIQLAEAGGAKVVKIREMNDDQIGRFSKGLTMEGKKEYATIGDQMSHQIITSGLKAVWPNLQYKSEERDSHVAATKVSRPSTYNGEVAALATRDEAVSVDQLAVWIDPLDATQEYTEGATDPELLKFVTVMICIAVKGRPIAGIIHSPYMIDEKTGKAGVTKWAWVGHGVSETLRQDIASGSKEGDTVRVIASRSHAGDVFEVAESSFEGYKKVEKIVAAGSGYKALQVAERKADLYLHTTVIKKWDICAGDAVLHTLGGNMTTRTGQEIDYRLHGDPKNTDGVIATATEKEHTQFLQKLTLL